MKFLNLNSLQTLASALLVAIPPVLVSQGCTLEAQGALDCSHAVLPFLLSPNVTIGITGFLAVLKFVVVPWLQPGGLVRNLFSPKVPISESGAVGTVAPDHVVTKP